MQVTTATTNHGEHDVFLALLIVIHHGYVVTLDLEFLYRLATFHRLDADLSHKLIGFAGLFKKVHC
jgi:hypothetical protein